MSEPVSPQVGDGHFQEPQNYNLAPSTAMGIVGNLKTMQLAELLQWLSQSQKTGTLHIQRERIEKKIFFREGRVISSASSRPEEYLGHFLVAQGFISDDDLTQAIQQQGKTGNLLGRILVDSGVISELDLHRLLRLKAEESIYDVFTWSEADFKFLDDVLPEHPMIPMNLDVTAIILEGVQRVDEWNRLRSVIPSSDAIPVQIAMWDETDLDAGKRKILDRVDDERTIAEIQRETRSTEFYIYRVLFDQYREGRLKVINPRWGGGTTTGRTQLMPTPSANGVVDFSLLLAAAHHFLAEKEYELALRHLRAARSLEPDKRETETALREGEKKVREAVEVAGVSLTSVPKLARKMEELQTLKISPQEGFMLTRITGGYDIQAIVKITPMPQLDALLVFWKLATAGHITLSAGKGK
ncbi:MAG TPA: DUF4388 domain-containing protein [Thermoanaerobaculia bacterium]|jgi:hypothetical protein|nr:DUF4388 domain-containing protein [Thermoanaerobaculia bacterium]